MYDLKHWSGVGLAKHVGFYEEAKGKQYSVLTFCQYGQHTAPLYELP